MSPGTKLDAYAVKTAKRPSALNCGPYESSLPCSPVADNVIRSVSGFGADVADVADSATIAPASAATDTPRMVLNTIPPVFPR
ncbi:hypothetical protein GCM10010317_042830 [Streptomyces mirabilis]|nr:hypothetical protein GCM10010317_042830 [Streptomyces mirabilis]